MAMLNKQMVLWWLMILLMMLYGDNFLLIFFRISTTRSIEETKKPLQAKRRCTQGLEAAKDEGNCRGKWSNQWEIAGKSMVFVYGKLDFSLRFKEFDSCLNFSKSLFCIVLFFFPLYFSPENHLVKQKNN